MASRDRLEQLKAEIAELSNLSESVISENLRSAEHESPAQRGTEDVYKSIMRDYHDLGV